jgi:hypothetical protein
MPVGTLPADNPDLQLRTRQCSQAGVDSRGRTPPGAKDVAGFGKGTPRAP